MKVGKAIYNILSQSTEVQSNFPFNDTNYTAVGSELVTNGNFSSGTGWIAGTGWSFSTNKAVFTGTSDAAIYQGDVTTVNQFYKVSIEVLTNEGTAANLISLGTNQINSTHLAVGVHTFYAQALGNTILYVWGRANEEFSITNISVQEIVLNKIFPELAPPGVEVPYIVYSVVSNSPSETKNTNGDIDTASIEVYGFQDTYNKAVDLGVSIRAALDRKTGTYNTIEIQSTNYVNEQMDVNEARKLWAAIQDYSIRIKNI